MSALFWTFITGFFAYGFTHVLAILFIVLANYGLTLHYVTSTEMVKKIQTEVKNSSMIDENGKAKWFFVSWKYIGSIVDIEKRTVIYIICTKKTYEELTSITFEKDSGTEIKTVPLWERSGTFWWLEYKKRDLNLTNFHPSKNQEIIIQNIKKYYEEKTHGVFFIYGKPGSGKSMCGLLTAKLLNGSIVRTFQPTQPNDNIASLYASISPSKNNPLIIIFDEVDIMFEKIYSGKINQHRDIPTEIYDKPSLNQFLDTIDLGVLYPYLVIIMTSNLSGEQIEESYDPSYIRKGRVTERYILDKNIE
jgi:hypothetical protein